MRYLRLKDLKDTDKLVEGIELLKDIILVGDSMEDMKLVVMSAQFFYEHFFQQYVSDSLLAAQKEIAEGKCLSWEEFSDRMEKYMGEEFYRFELNDYSAPSCTSGTKMYYGTIHWFTNMLSLIVGVSDYRDRLRVILDKFVEGEKDIINDAGFLKTKFATVGRLVFDRRIVTDKMEFQYENSYGFYYAIRAERTCYLVTAIKFDDGKTAVVYKAYIKNAEYRSVNDKSRWMPLGDMIWGHPGIIKVEKTKDDVIELSNTLAVLDSVFDNQTDAEKYIKEMSQPNLQAFFEDVFGDG